MTKGTLDHPTLDERHIRLLDVAARAAKSVTSILDPELLLHRTVDIICDEFGFTHAGVFLLDKTRRWAELRAAPDLSGGQVRRLAVDGDSLVSAAIQKREVQVALGAVPSPAPEVQCFPPTPASLVLPLEIGDEVIGALLVQCDERESFPQADITTLQIIADQLAIAINNSRLHRQIQELIHQSVRRARLLRAANVVGRDVATIPDLDELLPKTVDVICETYGFYYAGVFLIDESGDSAVLRAGRGEAGGAMVAAGYELPVDGNSMIGVAVQKRQAQIALDVDQETASTRNHYLPHTRSEMALPLIVGDKVLGAVTVQSIEERAFGSDDITSLQTMADYLAIAIHNAQVLIELADANAELVRSKTFEAIATATGEAVHWVGNKAAPIPGSVARISEDVVRYIALADALLVEAPPDLREHKFARLLANAAQTLDERAANLAEMKAQMARQPLKRLRRMLDIASIFEDLDIIQTGADAILNIKEDLVGPARKREIKLISLPDLLANTIASMGIPSEIVHTSLPDELPPVQADRKQLDRVFVNLIKNALEAMEGIANKKLLIWGQHAVEDGMVEINVTDNGPGIPPEIIDKIWVAFYTTKADCGGTGLGLSACLEIIQQSGGKIRVESQVGEGTTFTVSLPIAKT